MIPTYVRTVRLPLNAAAPLGLLAMVLTGCSAMPVSGPLSPSIRTEANSAAPPFILVPVNRMTLTALAHAVPDDLTPLAAPAPDARKHHSRR